MKVAIDSVGRLVVPKALRDELGLAPGTELELEAVDGELRARVPSRVRVEDGPYGPVLVADDAEPLTTEAVRSVLDGMRR